jgi:hypothetical protein
MAHAVHPFGGECSLVEIERVKKAAQQHQAKILGHSRHPVGSVHAETRRTLDFSCVAASSGLWMRLERWVATSAATIR